MAPGHPREGGVMEGGRDGGDVGGREQEHLGGRFFPPTDVELHGNHTCCASSSGRSRLFWRGAGVGGG